MAGSPHIIVDGARGNAWTWEKIAEVGRADEIAARQLRVFRFDRVMRSNPITVGGAERARSPW